MKGHTAPSFETFERLCEPYLKDNKYYINVRNPKTKTERTVRFYPDKDSSPFDDIDIKKLLGFSEGPIIIAGEPARSDLERFLSRSNARFHVCWGWYFVSTEALPSIIPLDINLISLSWEEASTDGKTLRPHKEIHKILRDKIARKEFIKIDS